MLISKKTIFVIFKVNKKFTMERDFKNEKRAFIIKTKNNIYSNDNYIVIAHNFAEAESIYWGELNGYHEIISIEVIQDINKVACCKNDLDEKYKIGKDEKTFNY